jgi:hypothetical protein
MKCEVPRPKGRGLPGNVVHFRIVPPPLSPAGHMP